MSKYDKQWFGVIFGLIGPVLGSFLYQEMLFHDLTYKAFVTYMVASESTAAIISLSAIFNLIIFFYFIWLKRYLAARGVILATFVYVLIVILLKFA